MFSKACEYGIRATIYIAMQSKKGVRTSLKHIADHTNSPVAFTAKILQVLAKNDIIHSIKGSSGGFEIEPTRMPEIKLSHIVSAIDGDSIYNGCGLGLSECSESEPCPVHDKFAGIRDGLKEMLESTNLEELSNGTLKGDTFLRR